MKFTRMSPHVQVRGRWLPPLGQPRRPTVQSHAGAAARADGRGCTYAKASPHLTHAAWPRNFGQPLCAATVGMPEGRESTRDRDDERTTRLQTCITGRPAMTFPIVGD